MVGVDATLDEIENIINNEQWGNVYAFLIDKEGATIFHPRMKASSKVCLYTCKVFYCLKRSFAKLAVPMAIKSFLAYIRGSSSITAISWYYI